MTWLVVEKRDKIIYRFSLDGVREYLLVIDKTHTEIIEGKRWPEHGNIIESGMEGNGYHGNCSHCGLALVTDLGYCSWDDTVCEIKEDKIVTVTHKFGWTKFENRATKLIEQKSNEYFSKLIHRQGWGKYNFQIKQLNLI